MPNYDLEMAESVIAARDLKIDKLTVALEEYQEKIAELRKFVDLQSEDEGLWFVAETAPESYVQRGLRGCHAMIEQLFAGDSDLPACNECGQVMPAHDFGCKGTHETVPDSES